MTNVLGIQLHEGEERCAVIRGDVRALLPRFLFGVAWTLLPAFFFFPLLRLGVSGFVLVVLFALGGLLYLLNLRSSWFGTGIVATTHRCIDVSRRGFAPATVVAVPWSDVTVVSLAPRSLLHTLLGVGTIRVDFVESRGFSFVMKGIRNPERMQQLLHEVQYLRKGKKSDV